MSKEIELKLVVLSSSLDTKIDDLLEMLHIPNVNEAWLVNTYFDTPDLQLNKRRVALRVREVGGRFIQTLKTKGSNVAGVHSRGEWEWELPSGRLDCSLLDLDAWPNGILVDDLAPAFETNFKRTSAIFEYGESKIELAVDEGFICSGDRRAPLCEIELELFEGAVSDLFSVAKKVASVIPVVPGNVSKAERGYRLGGKVALPAFDAGVELCPSYKAYIEALVDKKLSEWLQLYHEAERNRSFAVLTGMFSVLSSLEALLASLSLVDSGVKFGSVELLKLQVVSSAGLLEGLMSGSRDLEASYDALFNDMGAGELAVEIGEWLYLRKRSA